MQDVRLFIGEMEVEFKTVPEILYNWTETDITNPTSTLNGYSKTITIEGTSNNNKIFGHFWNLERYQYSTSNNGPGYNPSYRVPFVLYCNGNVFEKGYVKLQNVKISNGITTYEVGLFGGLGSFLYNLSMDWNTGEKKSLADLTYYEEPLIENHYELENLTEVDLGFTINKETVASAWAKIDDYRHKYSHINFAPCYNGLNDKMSNDKVLLNLHNASILNSAILPTGTTANGVPSDGYTIGTLPGELTEWETFDLRSWAQRPVIRTKTILDAIRRKANNRGKYDSGYEVILDVGDEWRDGFFGATNPYYEDSWMTLPLLSELNYTSNAGGDTAYTANWSSVSKSGNSYTYVFTLNEPVDEFGRTIDLTFDLYISVPGVSASDLYPSYWISAPYKTFFVQNAVGVQAYASNSTGGTAGVLGGASEVAWLCYEYAKGYDNVPYKSYPAAYKDCVKNKTYVPNTDNNSVNSIDGHFVRVSTGLYRWNSAISLKCDLPVGATCFKINVQMAGELNDEKNVSRYTTLLAAGHRVYLNSSSGMIEGAYSYYFNIDYSNKNTFQNRTFTDHIPEQTNYFSNRQITKEMLLSTDYTPADWLMAYCKMFGLYIHKDPLEDKIYIDSRDVFYRRNVVKDISTYIDYSKELTINPIAVDAGYYSMQNEFEESQTFKDYLDKYGKTYGMKIIQTGYEFDAETKDLMELPFKGAVQVRGNSKYYFLPMQTTSGTATNRHYLITPPYVFNGFSYNYYANRLVTDTATEHQIVQRQISTACTPFDASYMYFDLFDKPQFCDNENNPVDGANVFLFYLGKWDTSYASGTDLGLPYGYFLSDDCDHMARLNNGPCYILSIDSEGKDNADTQLVSYVYEMPKFSRYWIAKGTNKAKFSMDWGNPRQMYIPDALHATQAPLYDQFYKTYLEDLYDINTKVLNCYVKFDHMLTQEDLRNFYWFQNGIWRLNKVIDYNPTNEGTVKCEFIKVQDLANMTNLTPNQNKAYATITLSSTSVPASGGTIYATVVSSGARTSIDDNTSEELVITPRTLEGGDGVFTITVPANSEPTQQTYTLGIRCAESTMFSYEITQGAQADYCTVSPTAIPFDSTGESVSVLISGNTPWVVSGRPGWISMSRTSGSGTFYNMATASENIDYTARSGEIIISPQGLNPITIQVLQYGAEAQWSGEISFTFEPFQSTGQGFWDDYMIFYDFEGQPILSGQLLGYIPLGVQAYSGDWIYPDNYHYLSDDPNYVNSSAGFTSDTENDVFVPESFAGRTIYFQVEVGSQELGAKQSQVVSATIPQNGGTVYVTIPSF